VEVEAAALQQPEPGQALPLAPPWADRAACAGMDTEAFFDESAEGVAAAKVVCAGCAVLGECRGWALSHPEIDHGVFGGLTATERDRVRAGRPGEPAQPRRRVNRWAIARGIRGRPAGGRAQRLGPRGHCEVGAGPLAPGSRRVVVGRLGSAAAVVLVGVAVLADRGRVLDVQAVEGVGGRRRARARGTRIRNAKHLPETVGIGLGPVRCAYTWRARRCGYVVAGSPPFPTTAAICSAASACIAGTAWL
jgi:WhiB family redox-sensing transcriptional regulator